jgi:signal peptidase II
MNQAKKNLRWLWLTLFILVVDQLTKYISNTQMNTGESIHMLPIFNIALAHNQGAAFSLLSNAGGWQQWLFSIIAIVISCIVIVWLYRLPPKHSWSAAALALVLGGAIGNLVDRLYYGYVIDFLEFHIKQYYWPTFNVADSAVCIGVIMLLIEFTFRKKE